MISEHPHQPSVPRASYSEWPDHSAPPLGPADMPPDVFVLGRNVAAYPPIHGSTNLAIPLVTIPPEHRDFNAAALAPPAPGAPTEAHGDGGDGPAQQRILDLATSQRSERAFNAPQHWNTPPPANGSQGLGHGDYTAIPTNSVLPAQPHAPQPANAHPHSAVQRVKGYLRRSSSCPSIRSSSGLVAAAAPTALAPERRAEFRTCVQTQPILLALSPAPSAPAPPSQHSSATGAEHPPAQAATPSHPPHRVRQRAHSSASVAVEQAPETAVLQGFGARCRKVRLALVAQGVLAAEIPCEPTNQRAIAGAVKGFGQAESSLKPMHTGNNWISYQPNQSNVILGGETKRGDGKKTRRSKARQIAKETANKHNNHELSPPAKHVPDLNNSQLQPSTAAASSSQMPPPTNACTSVTPSTTPTVANDKETGKARSCAGPQTIKAGRTRSEGVKEVLAAQEPKEIAATTGALVTIDIETGTATKAAAQIDAATARAISSGRDELASIAASTGVTGVQPAASTKPGVCQPSRTKRRADELEDENSAAASKRARTDGGNHIPLASMSMNNHTSTQ